MVSELAGVNKTGPADDSPEELLEQIRRRGDQLLEEFEKLRGEDLESALPDLIALRNDQDKVLEIIEKLREDDLPN